MAAQIDLHTTDEGEGNFNFDKWIANNKLTAIQDLFIQHGATNLSVLTTTSPQFKSLLMDPKLLQQSHLLPLIMDALHRIPDNSDSQYSNPSYIIVSEDEHATINEMQKHIAYLDQTKAKLSELQTAYSKNKSNFHELQTSQINSVKAQINEYFTKIRDATNRRQQMLLNRLNADEDDHKQQKLQNILSDLFDRIEAEKQYIASALSDCKNIIKSKQSNTELRQVKINALGKQIGLKFNGLQEEINTMTERVCNRMENEQELRIINFIGNEKTCDELVQKIDKVGVIIVGDLEHDDDIKNMDDQGDDDELQQKVISLTKALANERRKSKALERKLTDLNDDDMLRVCKRCNRKYYEDVNKKGECLHHGKWHGTYDDCNALKCAIGLGKNIGSQHWSCCFSLDDDNAICKKSDRHEACD
eukprot:996858_1